MAVFQKVGQSVIDRTDYVWHRVVSNDKSKAGWRKYILCGAMTIKPPPPYPTPHDWLAGRFDIVTVEDRLLCPYEVGRK